jgi:hypothetical protein
MDSAYYGRGAVLAALAGGAAVSVTVRMNAQIKAAIAAIADDAWITIEYTNAVFDEASRHWVSRAEVAEVPFTAFASAKKSDAGRAVGLGDAPQVERRGVRLGHGPTPFLVRWRPSALGSHVATNVGWMA